VALISSEEFIRRSQLGMQNKALKLLLAIKKHNNKEETQQKQGEPTK